MKHQSIRVYGNRVKKLGTKFVEKLYNYNITITVFFS